LKVVATGGLSSILTPLASYFDEVNKLITLEGLRLIADRLKA
jgi:type III pantothenate kinase